ncbi:MAG: hypothetical protein KatS3mg101_0177 [Patescibacteria group bacterium]|nr:MAG: hypothetical protein KatS3mg101_0177 [Patescibacteria group bacterium]
MHIRNVSKIFIAPLLFISFASIVSAQAVLPAQQNQNRGVGNVPGSDNTTPNPNKLGNQERRCEFVTQRVNAKLERYRVNENLYQGIYLGLGNKLRNLLGRLEPMYGNTNEYKALEEDLAKLEELTEKLKSAVGEYKVRLEAMKTYACDESAGTFAAALKNAQDQNTTAREVIQEIKTFYLTDIKQDIAAMKAVILAQNQEKNETEE